MPKEIPQMRARKPLEAFSDMLRDTYESIAKQPLARVTDAMGLSDLRGTAEQFSKPSPKVLGGAMPGAPGGAGLFKLSKHAINPKASTKAMQVIDDAAGPAINASGESMASQEAMNRMASMAGKGEKYAVRQGGVTRPLIGPEAVDFAPRAGQEYGILDATGLFKLLQRGGK